MAAGDTYFFNQFWEDVGDGLHNLSSDTFYMGIVTNTTVPATTTTDPRWGAAGTTDFSAVEVTPGGNYSTGGVSLSAVITDNWSRSTGINTLDFDNVLIGVNASNPTTAYWGIIYNSTDTGKRCVGYIDLGGPVDMTAGSLSITWNTAGFGYLG